MHSAAMLKAGCLAVLLLISAVAHAQDAGAALIRERLNFYARAFPQVTFLWLRGVQDVDRLASLPRELGEGADDEDYAHPGDVRQTLINAELNRIATLLTQGGPSATLFRTGGHPAFPTRHVCVITLDDREFLTGPLAASRFLLGTQRVPDGLILPPVTALRFTVDHEVFHCLDARLYGPMFPETHSRGEAQYARVRAEMRADYYAALMRRAHAGGDRFIRILARVRTLSLLDWDIAHFTRPALDAALQSPVTLTADPAPKVLAARAHRAVQRLLPSYAHFSHWRAAAYRAAVTHGSQAAREDPSAPKMQFATADSDALARINRQLTQVVQLGAARQPRPRSVLTAANTLAPTPGPRPRHRTGGRNANGAGDWTSSLCVAATHSDMKGCP